MSIVPFFNRSLFDDVDSFFDDLFWDSPFGGYSLYPARGRQQQGIRPRNWTTTLRLSAYRPEEVKWECAPGNTAVKIHARHQTCDSEDFSEIRRTIDIPDTVERERLEVSLTREGILVVKAPYKQQEIQTARQDVLNPWAMTPWRDWNLLTEEMRALQNNLLQFNQQSFPGSVSTRFVTGDDGSTKLNMDFDLGGYKPDEIHVSQEGNQVSVEANHEKKTDTGFSKKHFKRVFTLPENVKVNELKSKLMPNGQLRLEAPCDWKESPQQQQAIEGHEIPVKRQNSKTQ